MKKTILCVIIVLLLIPFKVSAAEYEFAAGDDMEIYPTEEMDGLMNGLPEEVRGEIEEFISAKNDEERYSSLKDKLDVYYWLEYIAGVIRDILLPTAGSCAALLCVILVSSVLTTTLGIRQSEGLRNICNLVLSLVMAVSVAEIAYSAINTATEYIARICTMMTSMLPVMEAIMLTGGSVSQSQVNGTALMLYITVTENVTRFVIVPLASALFALTTTSGVFSGVNISSLISGVRRLLMTVFGFFLMIFSFVLGIQSSLARSADTLGMKTVRFALGSYVPVVGGAVSEALSTISGGLSLIRKTTGAVGIVIILLIVLPTLLKLFLSRMSLVICKTVSDILGCADASRILGDADSILSVFLGLAVMSAIFFIFAVTLFMNSGLS